MFSPIFSRKGFNIFTQAQFGLNNTEGTGRNGFPPHRTATKIPRENMSRKLSPWHILYITNKSNSLENAHTHFNCCAYSKHFSFLHYWHWDSMDFCHLLAFATYFYSINWVLKEAESRDFRPLFFSWIKPIWPLINRLKWFCLKIRIREDIRIRSLKNSTSRSVILHRVENFWQANPLKCL